MSHAEATPPGVESHLRRVSIVMALCVSLFLLGCATLPPPTLSQRVWMEVRTVQPYYSRVQVQVRGNTAYLYGFTESVYDSNLMTLAARRVEGIERVVNHLYTTN